MEEKLDNKIFIGNKVRELQEMFPKYKVFDSYSTIYLRQNKFLGKTEATVSFEHEKITIYNEKIYEQLKKFGEKNAFETLVKAWDGAYLEEIE